MSSDSAKVLLPPAGAVIVAAAGAAVTWAKDLNGTARRARVLDEATKRVQFWDLWLKTLSGMTEDASVEKRRAVREFRLAADVVQATFRRSMQASDWTVAEFLDYKGGVNPVRRFLMLYREPSHRARGFRRFAYMIAAILVGEGYVMVHLPFLRLDEAGPELQRIFHLVGYVVGGGTAVYIWNQARGKFVEREALYIGELAQEAKAAKPVEG